MPQVLTIGNASVDHFVTLPDNYAEAYCDIKTHTDSLIIPYGAKIPIQESQILLGGNAANVSVSLSRLGIKVLPVIPLGIDEFSHFALSLLEKEKVIIDGLNILEDVKCDVNTILRYIGERTILSIHTPKTYNIPLNIYTPYIYLSSHSTNNISLSTEVLKYIETTQSKLIFAPGNIQITGEKEILEALITKSFLFICNKTEAYEILTKIDQKEVNPVHMLHRLRHFGAKNIVITDGSNGVYFLEENSEQSGHLKSIVKREFIIDSTGAGDATCSGIIYGLLKNKNIKDSVHIGIKNAISVLKQVGAQTGLLRPEDLK